MKKNTSLRSMIRATAFMLAIITLSALALAPISVSAANEQFYEPYFGTSCSIVEILNRLNICSTFGFRAKIAVASGIVETESQYRGTAQQNTRMVELAKIGRLARPDYNPNAQVTMGKTNTNTSSTVNFDEKITVGKTVSNITINTTSGNYYVTRSSNAKLKTATSWYASTYATLSRGTLIKVDSAKGDFYVTNINGQTYYIKKSCVKKPGSTFEATLLYTTKEVPLRTTPYQTGASTSYNQGTVLPGVGSLKNSKGNTWYCVYKNGSISYVYSGNVNTAGSINLKMTSNTMLAVGSTAKATYITNPTGISARWSSSNSDIVYVDIGGTVKGISPGTATVYCNIDSLMTVSIDVTVYEYAKWPSSIMAISQIAYETYSHHSQNGIDFVTDGSRVIAPFTFKITYIDWFWNYVVVQSCHKVRLADGTLGYVTASFMHDNDISNLWVGKIINQGEAFYDMGTAGGNSTGNHVHFSIWRGRVNGYEHYGSGNMYVFDALHIDRNYTKKIINPGLLSKSLSESHMDAPTNYSNYWKYIN